MDKELNIQESVEPEIDPTQSSAPYEQDNYQSVNANAMLEQYYKFKETINKLLQVIRKSELSAVEKLEQIKDAIQRISVVALYSSYGSSQNDIEESLHQSVQQSSMEAINPIIFQLKNNMHNLRLENEELKENIVKMQKLKQEELSKMKEELQRVRMETKNKQVLTTIMQDSIGEELSKIKKRMSKQDPQIIPQQIVVSQIIQTQKTQSSETANMQQQIIQKAKQIQDLNLLNQQLQKQLSQLTEEINKNKQRFQQRSQEGQQLIRQLQQKLQLKERRLLEITQEMSNLKIETNSLINEISLKGVALYDARNQLQFKKRQIVQLQQELKKKAHLVEPNQKELQTLKTQILSLKANQKQAALRYQLLSNNITSQSEQYSKTREAFLQDISKLKMQLQIEFQSSKKLQETIDHLVTKNESLRRQISEAKKQEQEEHLPSKEELFRYISKMGRSIATKEGRLSFKQELNMMVSSIK